MHYDIVIIGGGLVGLTLAHALSQNLPLHRPAKIALVEKKPLLEFASLDQAMLDSRTTALSYGSANIYRALGLWSHICEKATPIMKIRVSQLEKFGQTEIHSNDFRIPALGYVINNDDLLTILINQRDVGNLCLHSPAVTKNISIAKDGVEIELEENTNVSNITASLVVLADGGRSEIYRQLSIKHDSKDYKQSAMIANIELDRCHHGLALERFARSGPMALLPISGSEGRHVSTVCCASHKDIVELKSLTESECLCVLQDKFGYELGVFKKLGKRDSYPLSLRTVNEQIRPHLVVLGNAAHTLHPVAGQGFNLALRDIMQLTECLKNSESYGNYSDLYQYLQRQQADQTTTISMTDGFIDVFASTSMLTKPLKDMGLLALDHSSFAKSILAKQAMGLRNHIRQS